MEGKKETVEMKKRKVRPEKFAPRICKQEKVCELN